MEEGIEEKKKSMSAVVIVLIVIGILVVLAVVGTVVIAGITFLWASSLTTDDGGSVETLLVDGEIDGTADTLTLTILSGTWDRSELQVIVEGVTLTTTTTTASAGQKVVFSSPSWDPVPGTTYMVNVVSISDNLPLFGRSITAQ